MKTSIFLIGMVSLGFLNVNQAANAKQVSFNLQPNYEQFLVNDSIESELKNIENESEKNYYFDPTTVLPITKKSIEQRIMEDNLIVESDLEIDFLNSKKAIKSVEQIIYEDVQITEASNLDNVQPLNIVDKDNNLNSQIDFLNKSSLKTENIKL